MIDYFCNNSLCSIVDVWQGLKYDSVTGFAKKAILGV